MGRFRKFRTAGGKVQFQCLREEKVSGRKAARRCSPDVNTRRQVLLGGTAAVAVVALTGLSRGAMAQASSDKFEIVKSDEEWRRELTSEQYAVLRRHKTERPWSSALNNEHRPGTYLCGGCDLP